MKVYAVETGCYSDRQVRGLFSTRAKAQKYIDQCNESEECWHRNDFNDIQEWTLDATLEEREYTRHNVGIMLDDGSIEGKMGCVSSQKWGIPQSHVYTVEKVPAYGDRGVARAESHRSAKHAMKLAVEARQEFLRKRAGQL